MASPYDPYENPPMITDTDEDGNEVSTRLTTRAPSQYEEEDEGEHYPTTTPTHPRRSLQPMGAGDTSSPMLGLHLGTRWDDEDDCYDPRDHRDDDDCDDRGRPSRPSRPRPPSRPSRPQPNRPPMAIDPYQPGYYSLDDFPSGSTPMAIIGPTIAPTGDNAAIVAVVVDGHARSNGNKLWQGVRFRSGSYTLERGNDTFVGCVFEENFRLIVRGGSVTLRGGTTILAGGIAPEDALGPRNWDRERELLASARQLGRRRRGGTNGGGGTRHRPGDHAIVSIVGTGAATFIDCNLTATDADTLDSLVYVGGSNAPMGAPASRVTFDGVRVLVSSSGRNEQSARHFTVVEIDSAQPILFTSSTVTIHSTFAEVSVFAPPVQRGCTSATLTVTDSVFTNSNPEELFVSLVRDLWSAQPARTVVPTISIQRSTLNNVRVLYYVSNVDVPDDTGTLPPTTIIDDNGVPITVIPNPATPTPPGLPVPSGSTPAPLPPTGTQCSPSWTQNIYLSDLNVVFTTASDSARGSPIEVEGYPSGTWTITLNNVNISTNLGNVPMRFVYVGSLGIIYSTGLLLNLAPNTTGVPWLVIEQVGNVSMMVGLGVALVGYDIPSIATSGTVTMDQGGAPIVATV